VTEEKKMGIDTPAAKDQGANVPGDAVATPATATTTPAGPATASDVKPVAEKVPPTDSTSGQK
jgi:hypothetical protein